MYLSVQTQIQNAVRDFARRQWQLDVSVLVSVPPRPEMGDMALPLAMELARKLRRPPRQIADEIAAALRSEAGIARVEVAGAGYVNLFLDRSAYAARLASARDSEPPASDSGKIIVEHTNINPNKAAHIGHLRNAALGDTFVRLLRARGARVEVQNYIDNTGVQVADVVAGFLNLENKTPGDVARLIADPTVRFDYYCWDLYARVSRYFEEDKTRLELRQRMLQAIEKGEGDAAKMAEMVATEIVRHHLATMSRLGVEYELLPRESEILHLRFWDQAFEMLKQKGAIYLESEGKNKGCWVMRQKESAAASGDAPVAATPEAAAEDTKVIVRSNGTVTYVGKDIAYQLWKFGLLGRDFYYRPFHTYANGRVVWVTSANEDRSADGPPAHAFGRGKRVYNVIDARQSYLQEIVAQGLRALGYEAEAERSIHFSYEMVALSPRTCEQMGIALSAEEKARPFVEVSGRRGLGIKADDLIDRLIAEAQSEVDSRHPDDSIELRREIAHQIAIGALRYFLLKYTCNAIIAFDLQEALSFEGETGPYVQYAVVRARNIFRKLADAGGLYEENAVTPELLTRYLSSPDGDDFWQILYLASQWEAVAEQAIVTTEPAAMAKFSFQLAQAFNNFYHRHRILIEPDPARKTFLLWVVARIDQHLTRALDLLGIEVPAVM